MKNTQWAVLGVTLSLMGASAGLLVFLQSQQKIGHPGVKVVAEPVYDPDGKAVADHSVYLPEQVLNYTSKPTGVTSLELGWLPKDTTYGRRQYVASDGFQMLVSVVLMGTDRTSIHQPQYCLTGQGWRISRSEGLTIPMQRPQPYDLPVMKLTAGGIQKTEDGKKIDLRAVYVYWFVADHELTSDHLQRMWWTARDLIRSGTLQRWAYVSCFSVCLPGQEQATYERMKQFISAAVPEFQLTPGLATPDTSPLAASQ